MLRRRRRAVAMLVGLLVLAAGGYTVAAALAPLPDLRAELSAEPEVQVDADVAAAEGVVAAEPLPTAIGWGDGEAVWSNDDSAYSLASVSKLVTVLVGLETEPLEPGADGPTYEWSVADQQRQQQYRAMLGVTYPTQIGQKFTLRQMLQLVLLPSANDFAASYVARVFGDNETFLKAVEAWKKKHGIESLQLVEPTGMDERNRASAADLVRIARIALQNPTILEFTGMRTATLPWGTGTVENTNPILGQVPGVIGIKTGSLSTVGFNFVAAQTAEAFGREVVNISVTLARPSKEARAASGRDVLAAMAPLPQEVTLVEEGEEVGSVITWQGERVNLVTDADATAVLLPGESARRTVDLGSIGPGAAGSPAGEVQIESPLEAGAIPLVTDAPIVEPDLWWRLTHPAELFG